jgi:hypothetical protein
MESDVKIVTDWKDLDHDLQNNPNLLQNMERIECEVKSDLTIGLGAKNRNSWRQVIREVERSTTKSYCYLEFSWRTMKSRDSSECKSS